jgi:CPA2 family monovalent cation:H+ antiporter-2
MGLIVGVERNGERLLNPESSFTFENGDIVWIVGDEKQLESYLKV